jgi:hypothetical protein
MSIAKTKGFIYILYIAIDMRCEVGRQTAYHPGAGKVHPGADEGTHR